MQTRYSFRQAAVVAMAPLALVAAGCGTSPEPLLVVNECEWDLEVQAGLLFSVEQGTLSDFVPVAPGASKRIEVKEGQVPEPFPEQYVFRVVRRGLIIFRPLDEVAQEAADGQDAPREVVLTGELCLDVEAESGG